MCAYLAAEVACEWEMQLLIPKETLQKHLEPCIACVHTQDGAAEQGSVGKAGCARAVQQRRALSKLCCTHPLHSSVRAKLAGFDFLTGFYMSQTAEPTSTTSTSWRSSGRTRIALQVPLCLKSPVRKGRAALRHPHQLCAYRLCLCPCPCPQLHHHPPLQLHLMRQLQLLLQAL